MKHSLSIGIASSSGDKWMATASISAPVNFRSKGEGLCTSKDNNVNTPCKAVKLRASSSSICGSPKIPSQYIYFKLSPPSRHTHTHIHTLTAITKEPNLSYQQSAFMGPLSHFSCLQCLKKDVNYVCDKASDNISKLLSKCKLKHIEGQEPWFEFSWFFHCLQHLDVYSPIISLRQKFRASHGNMISISFFNRIL